MGDGQTLAAGLPIAHLPLAADVGGTGDAVVDPHATAAPSAGDDPLQEALAWLGRPPAGGELAAVVLEQGPIAQVALPADVGRVMIAHQDLQLVQRPPPPRSPA